MSKQYQVFCDSCNCDYSILFQNENEQPKHCVSCGVELDSSSVVEEDDMFDDSEPSMEEFFKDIDEWK